MSIPLRTTWNPNISSYRCDWLGLGHKGIATMGGYNVRRPFQKSWQTGDDNRILQRVDTAPHYGATIIYSHWLHIGLSLIGCAPRRARDTRGGDRPANGGGALRRTR